MTVTEDQLADTGGRITAFHVVVVGLSLLLTLSAWQVSHHQTVARTATRFAAERDRAVGLTADRMKRYEDALWAGVSAIESHGGDMTHDAWHAFAQTLQIEEKYPGINGIGVIHFLTDDTIGAYLARQRLTRPGFRVHPAHDLSEFLPITFIEPEDINAAAVGLDVAHELNRRTAAHASRDTGKARITGPIVLVQDAGNTPGFLFYAPFYRAGAADTVAERQERFTGAVYAPFVVHKLMEGLLAKDLRDVRFSIRDGDQTIYDEHDLADPLHDPDPMFAESIPMQMYGRTWTLDIRTNLAFRAENTNSQPTMILIGGLVIDALIISLLVHMSRANRRAIKMTAALKQESEALARINDELAKKNEELEQFAYVTSHDLKTPIRGIGSLTEMIREDLEEYLASPDTNPDVGRNLARIQERTNRMTDLTRGVMEITRIGLAPQEDADLYLAEVVETLSADLGLAPGQLQLTGDVDTIRVDTFNFRRVLENLVGNAVKHHDGARPLQINLSATAAGDKYTVSVQDNGPGIDARYHEKVFVVFQTLRVGDAPESTGIGLVIVKKIVERHGGKVILTSTPGQGATFTFDWPRRLAVRAHGRTKKVA